jgi:hypothetical protein
MSGHNNKLYGDYLPGLEQLRIMLAAADEAARPDFEARMRSEGVKDFTRGPKGIYVDAMLQWSWEDWRLFTRAGVPA